MNVYPLFQNTPKLSKEAEDTINGIKLSGIRFNIVNQVDKRVELHYAVRDLFGHDHVHFICEVDMYGGITEYGPTFPEAPKMKNFFYNADGEKIAA